MLQTPWLKAYETLGVEVNPPANLTLADYMETHVQQRPDALGPALFLSQLDLCASQC